MSGMGEVVGGWSYVWAAYAITFAGLAIYTVSVVLRSRSEAARLERELKRKEI